ncbi:hypothetical protein Rhe02_33240 [Rhizocola hellebori]|uniref:Uncharacterized protein n=1 Tax=Rhizocola hellebori TaxID=1392758 RepID=A0A8J3Q8Q0_9ACTN|nr:hypothetical protein Rhe02_33240 [Rhizocola hellebori]
MRKLEVEATTRPTAHTCVELDAEAARSSLLPGALGEGTWTQVAATTHAVIKVNDFMASMVHALAPAESYGRLTRTRSRLGSGDKYPDVSRITRMQITFGFGSVRVS